MPKTDIHGIERACPVCGAGPGQPCVTRKRTVDAPGSPPPRNVAEPRRHPHPERLPADRVAPVPLTKDGKRRIVRTGSQTFTVKLTRGELAYLAWYEAKQRAEETPAS
jgi:hypothetical protein